MVKGQDLTVQEKKELASKEESTIPARYYVPYTDIYETDDALTVVMEIPGVDKQEVKVGVEEDVLRVEDPDRFQRIFRARTDIHRV